MRDAFDEMHTFATLVALCATACGGMTSSGTSQSNPSDTGGRSGAGSGSAGRASGSSGGSPGVISNGGGPTFPPLEDPPPRDPPLGCAPVALLYEFGDAATCSWKIPPPPQGQKFMPNLVNLEFDSGDGGSRESLYHVSTQDDCGAAPSSWYYDDEKSPTYLALCPETCRRYSSPPGSAKLYIVFGCSGPLPLL
jgi:hypothetical protein